MCDLQICGGGKFLPGPRCVLPLQKPSGILSVMAQPATRRPRLQTKEQAAKARRVPDTKIEEVFVYWRDRINPNSRAVLDAQRRQRIGWAVHDYGVDGCRKAIDGIQKSPWHMGDNPQGKRYVDVELIFRNAANVEKFIALADKRDARDARQEFLENPEW